MFKIIKRLQKTTSKLSEIIGILILIDKNIKNMKKFIKNLLAQFNYFIKKSKNS